VLVLHAALDAELSRFRRVGNLSSQVSVEVEKFRERYWFSRRTAEILAILREGEWVDREPVGEWQSRHFLFPSGRPHRSVELRDSATEHHAHEGSMPDTERRPCWRVRPPVRDLPWFAGQVASVDREIPAKNVDRDDQEAFTVDCDQIRDGTHRREPVRARAEDA
jgi:hypothetical protein